MTPISALHSFSAASASGAEYLAKRKTGSLRSSAATTSGSGREPGFSGAAKTLATVSPRATKASSADLTPDAHKVVADAVRRMRETGTRSVRIEARASATGSPAANQRLAETRSQVVADELAADGLSPAMLHQVPIGQTGSGDPSVAERRVDIVLER